MSRRRPPQPPFDAALPTLRRRGARLTASLDEDVRAFVRLVPLLFEARFRRPALDTDPPGLVQPPRRRRWGRLCERLQLPPPHSFSTHRPLIESVVLAPTAAGALELLVIPVGALAPLELQRLAARVEAVRALAERYAPDLDLRMATAAELSASLFAWAAVVAGDVPPGCERAELDWHDAFARAPTPLLRCLMLLVPADAASPLALLRTGHAPSSPSDFAAHWSAHPVARDVAALVGKPLSAAELTGLARRLRLACLAALRATPLRERASLRAMLGPALFCRRVPRVLRPLLDQTAERTPPTEVQVQGGWQLELDGLALVRARTREQLRARALAESPKLVARDAGPFWQRVSLAVDANAPRALASVEPQGQLHLVVSVPALGRPCARRVSLDGLYEFILAAHRKGTHVELLAAPGCEPPLLARCSHLLVTRLKPDEAVGLQLGDRVILLDGPRARRLPLSRALTRPRRLTWIAEQADMARALRRPLSTGLPTVQVVAFPQSETEAALFAIDAQGLLYREVVERDQLEATLHELREVLRHGTPPALLAASVHPLLTSLAGRRTEPGPAITLTVRLTDRGDQAVLDDETFGAGTALPWSALGEAVLSRWPPGTWGHVAVERVMAPTGTSGLRLLAARSRVLRRVNTHLARISRNLRAA